MENPNAKPICYFVPMDMVEGGQTYDRLAENNGDITALNQQDFAPVMNPEMYQKNVQEKMQLLSGLCGMRLTAKSKEEQIPMFWIEDVATTLGFYIKPNTSAEEAKKYAEHVFSIADPENYRLYKSGRYDGVPEESVYKILMMIDTDIAFRFREFMVSTVIPFFKQNYQDGRYNKPLFTDRNTLDSTDNWMNSWFNKMNLAISDIAKNSEFPRDLIVKSILGALWEKNHEYYNDRLDALMPVNIYKDERSRTDFESILGQMLLANKYQV